MSGKTASIVVSNSIFVAAIYAGWLLHWDWLLYAVAGFVWFMLVTYISAVTTKGFEAHLRPSPAWLGNVFDGIALAGLVSAGWYITACVYFATALILFVAQQRADAVRSRTQPREEASNELPFVLTITTMNIDGTVDTEVAGHSATEEIARTMLDFTVQQALEKFADDSPVRSQNDDGTVMLHTDGWSKVFSVVNLADE